MAQSVQVKKVSWWHERLVDHMLAHPEQTLTQIAHHFKISLSWLSIVKNSDVFKDYWLARSEAHSAALVGNIKDKAFAAAEQALDIINHRLERDAQVIPLETALNVVETTMKRFGYGSDDKGASPQVNMHFHGLVSQDQLAQARARMRGEVVTVEATAEVPSPAVEHQPETTQSSPPYAAPKPISAVPTPEELA